MKFSNIEKALGYELSLEDGGAFLQKAELNRLDARLPEQSTMSKAEAKALLDKITDQRKRINALQHRLMKAGKNLLSKKELEQFRSETSEIPSSSFNAKA